MVNTDLLRKVREALTTPEAHPGLGWSQYEWATRGHMLQTAVAGGVQVIPPDCGTSMCVAGWTCHLAGDTIEWDGDDVATYVTTASGEMRTIRGRACELLGVEDRPSSLRELFAGSTPPDRVIEIIDTLLLAGA